MRAVLRFFLSPTLWTFIGLLVLSWLIWRFSGQVAFNGFAPLSDPLARIILIAVIWVIWLIRVLIRQLRAARANQSFVSDLAKPAAAPIPGQENVAEVNEKFKGILD
ncbi:MAG: hypothetical protein AAF914_06305, partial [Pseudomonadota bacterium]